jgi:hypothetical protein
VSHRAADQTEPDGWTTPHTEADGVDAVAVWITRKTAEIVGIVFAEDPGRVQDFSANRDGGCVERVNS